MKMVNQILNYTRRVGTRLRVVVPGEPPIEGTLTRRYDQETRSFEIRPDGSDAPLSPYVDGLEDVALASDPPADRVETGEAPAPPRLVRTSAPWTRRS